MYCRITSTPIDPVELLRRVRTNEDGAVLLFTGAVRNHDAGRAVVGLTYDAYEAMAANKLEEICEEVSSRFEVGEIAIVHRVGELAVGDVSVAIAVASPHRDAAYKASRELIERLKREVPIWKRERYTNGDETWLEGFSPQAPKTD
jgi:molybdopterin synthase catalytic subunit